MTKLDVGDKVALKIDKSGSGLTRNSVGYVERVKADGSLVYVRWVSKWESGSGRYVNFFKTSAHRVTSLKHIY